MYQTLKRWLYRKPKYLNVWYNQAVHTNELYPHVFNDKGTYIPCKLGMVIKMFETSNNQSVYYKIIRIIKTPGGDWLYDSDNINCQLKYSHIN